MARTKGAKNKPKETKEKKPRAKKGAAPVATGAGSNSMDPKVRELARHHRDSYITAKAAMSKAQRRMQALGKEVKGDGLTMRQIKLMVELMTPEGEAAFRMNVANDLLAAQYQGAAVGSQLALFLEPDRTPSADIAYDEGQQDSMDGKAANPKYAPSVPQYASYMKGFHDDTERRTKAGITKPDKPRGEVLAASREKNATAPEKMN